MGRHFLGKNFLLIHVREREIEEMTRYGKMRKTKQLQRRIYTFALWMCIEDDSSSVNVKDESWSVYTFQWFNSFHYFSKCRLLK
jgi:hypothetical protein